MINEIKCKNSYTGWVIGKTIRTSGDIGSVVDFTEQTSQHYNYQIIPCLAGSEFTLTLQGATYARAWCFVDKDDKIVSHADANAVVTNFQIVAPCDGKLIVNNYRWSPPNPSVTGVCRCDKIQHKDGEVRKVYCNEVLDGWVKDKYINVGIDIGSHVDITPSQTSQTIGYITIPCQFGDKFVVTLNTTIATSARVWAFIDKDNNLVSVAPSNTACSNTELVAPCDGTAIFQNKFNTVANPSVKKLSKIWYPHGLVDIGANQSFSITQTGKFLTTRGNIGEVVNFTESADDRWGYCIVSVKKGDTFTLTCDGGGSAPRAWCFTDNQRKIVSNADAYVTCTALSLTASCDGYLIVENNFENIVSPSLVRTNAHTYPTVKIGTREWLGANLDETLGKIQTDEFYYNNDKFTYGKYGKLYKWDTLCSASETHSTALAGILPTGWRLAKKADFDNLVALDSTGSLFRDENFSSGGNNSNMSLLAGGLRNNSEAFDLIGQSGYCWSSSKLSTFATRLIVNNNAISINDSGSSLVGAYSVRLVRDHLPTPTYTLPRTTFTGQASDIVNTHKKIMLATGDSEGVDNWTLFINVESNTSSNAGRMWDVAFNATQTGGIDGSCLSSGTTGNAFATYKKTSWDTIFTTPRKIAIRRSTSKDYIQYSLDGVTWIDTWIEVSKITATASAISRRVLCFGGRADLGSSAGTGTMSATLWDTALDDVSSMFV